MQNFFSSVMWKLLKQNTIYYLSNISKNFNVPGGIWTRDLSHLNPPLNQLSYQDFDMWTGLTDEIGAEIRILASGREMDPGRSQVTITGPAGIFKFMLDLVSDIEIDDLLDLIPKL